VSPVDLPHLRDRRFGLVSLPQASISSETIDRGAVVVRLRGAVGVTNVAEIATCVLDALGRPGSDVIVDLRDMTFIHSRVVRTFLLALRQAEERNHAVAVVRPDPNVWRTFQLADLDGAFPSRVDPVDASRQRGGRPAADRRVTCSRASRFTVDEVARRATSCSVPSPPRLPLRVLDREAAFAAQSGTPLTPRERRVLFELARGRTTDTAAAVIGLSPHTVRSHLKSAARKLGAQTRTQAVALAITRGAIVVDARPASRFARPPA
jgi:anti-anti-sigma factor